MLKVTRNESDVIYVWHYNNKITGWSIVWIKRNNSRKAFSICLNHRRYLLDVRYHEGINNDTHNSLLNYQSCQEIALLRQPDLALNFCGRSLSLCKSSLTQSVILYYSSLTKFIFKIDQFKKRSWHGGIAH